MKLHGVYHLEAVAWMDLLRKKRSPGKKLPRRRESNLNLGFHTMLGKCKLYPHEAKDRYICTYRCGKYAEKPLRNKDTKQLIYRNYLHLLTHPTLKEGYRLYRTLEREKGNNFREA